MQVKTAQQLHRVPCI